MSHHLRDFWAGPALSLSLIGLLAIVSLSSLRSPTMAASLTPAADVGRVTVEFHDTTISPLDSQFAMPIYITHEVLDLAGVDIWIFLSRPDLIRVPDTMWVRQYINCPDTTCDTTYDTTVATQLDMEGAILSDWYDPAFARVFGPTAFRYISVYNPTAGHEPVPPSDTAQLLCRILWEPLMPPEVLDTLQDRSITWFFGFCNYTDPNGTTLGRRDSVFCVNPPDCDTLDTVWIDDNLAFEGTMTIGPSCEPGDANRDLTITSADVIFLVNHTFKGGPEPECNGAAGDTNCSGEINSTDIILLVNYVFKSGPLPCSL